MLLDKQVEGSYCLKLGLRSLALTLALTPDVGLAAGEAAAAPARFFFSASRARCGSMSCLRKRA